VIPDEAVEAGYAAVNYLAIGRDEIRAILEAAAPHMQRLVTTQEELDALPLNSVILDREGLPLHKDDSDRVEVWCFGDNAVEVLLPAKVISRPAK